MPFSVQIILFQQTSGKAKAGFDKWSKTNNISACKRKNKTYQKNIMHLLE